MIEGVCGLLKRYRAFVLYAVFGVLTTLVNVATYYACYELLGIPNVVSTVVSWFTAVSFAFVTNKEMVFGSDDWAARRLLAEGGKYLAARVSTGLIEVGMMYVLVDVMCYRGTWMRMLTCVVVIILNFILSRFFVFKSRDDI